ncbi:MAG TPA: universal stress protein [Chryseosolibacter sp.]|nr:universal stress protein [Chryseosolibacter sp.]
MKQILCVIDFSESAGRVWSVATGIASACGAHLIVLFPYRLIDYTHEGDIPSLKRKLETEAKTKFFALKSSNPLTENVACEFHAEIGFMADRIKAYVKRNTIDMVVIGQEPTTGAIDTKGFNLQELISSSKLPFIIVPAPVKAEASF